jgi:hypothetical protein
MAVFNFHAMATWPETCHKRLIGRRKENAVAFFHSFARSAMELAKNFQFHVTSKTDFARSDFFSQKQVGNVTMFYHY